MIKKAVVILILVGFGTLLVPLVLLSPFTELTPLAQKYVSEGPAELGSANLVTSVIVTYRGLDTLGEVTVLFLATAGVGFLLQRRRDKDQEVEQAKPSEILRTASNFLVPLFFLLGIYIFMHGHLSPGGGFQGGVIIASAVLLIMLSHVSYELNETVLGMAESLSGFSVVVLAVLGVVLAGGFLDNRFLPLGNLGELLSAGAIPLIYSLIGIKVGAELTGILDRMSRG